MTFGHLPIIRTIEKNSFHVVLAGVRGVLDRLGSQPPVNVPQPALEPNLVAMHVVVAGPRECDNAIASAPIQMTWLGSRLRPTTSREHSFEVLTASGD